MTATFVPLLLKSHDPRLLFLASGTSTLAGTENPNTPINKVPAAGWPKTGGNVQTNIPAYRSAKCGMNMMMRGASKMVHISNRESTDCVCLSLLPEWHRMLKEDGVKVWCLSPGFLATGLGGNAEALKSLGAGDPAIAGQSVKSILEGQRDGDVGRVLFRDGVQPW